jgi:hypothetical protein
LPGGGRGGVTDAVPDLVEPLAGRQALVGHLAEPGAALLLGRLLDGREGRTVLE